MLGQRYTALDLDKSLVGSVDFGMLGRAFIEYCQSGEVHDLVRDLYFVPVAKRRG